MNDMVAITNSIGLTLNLCKLKFEYFDKLHSTGCIGLDEYISNVKDAYAEAMASLDAINKILDAMQGKDGGTQWSQNLERARVVEKRF